MAKKPRSIVVRKAYYAGAIMTIRDSEENRLNVMFGVKWHCSDLPRPVSESSIQSHRQLIYWISDISMCDPDPKIEQNLLKQGKHILSATNLYLSRGVRRICDIR
jgi:hypothetical protein